MGIVLWIAALAWGWLLAFRGLFWKIDALPVAPEPSRWPEVVAVIPARNEAACIGETVRSLLTQEYPGKLSVVVTDDSSDDGTADKARAAASDLGAADRLTIVSAPPLPEGWSGKMWAQEQGLAAAVKTCPDAELYLLSDADIRHGPGQLRRMVARLQAERLDLASLMVHLSTETFAERAVVPAFVFFFRLLYPFRWVADQTRGRGRRLYAGSARYAGAHRRHRRHQERPDRRLRPGAEGEKDRGPVEARSRRRDLVEPPL